MGWQVLRKGDTVHVVPDHDTKGHLFNQDCWCQPQVETHVATLVTHRDELDRLELDAA